MNQHKTTNAPRNSKSKILGLAHPKITTPRVSSPKELTMAFLKLARLSHQLFIT